MRRSFAAVLTAAALLLSACGAPGTTSSASAANDPLAGFYDQQLQWKPCNRTLQCATYEVPLDYTKPAARRISIAVARAQAKGNRVGNLVLDPGGPGGSGVEFIKDPDFVVSHSSREAFDLIGFDPRGVGGSNPLWCVKGAALDAMLESDPTPDDAAERRALVTQNRTLREACIAEDAELAAHVSTMEAARDLDILRALLGDERLRYLGKSYGTTLGLAYATLFPSHVGAFVLDGAVDPTLSPSRTTADQLRGFELAARHFVDWCIDTGDCVLGETRTSALRKLGNFMRALDAKPLRGEDPLRPLTESMAFTAITGSFYLGQDGWEWLLQGLESAIEKRNGAALIDINDWFTGRGADGAYGDNANTALLAITCLDAKFTGSVDATAKRAVAWAKRYPLFGGAVAWADLACVGWPVQAVEPVTRISVHDVPAMLIVGSTFDPATPIGWARSLARQLPDARLIERIGEGHTGYAMGSACIDKAVDAFLRSPDPQHPNLPVKGLRCG